MDYRVPLRAQALTMLLVAGVLLASLAAHPVHAAVRWPHHMPSLPERRSSWTSPRGRRRVSGPTLWTCCPWRGYKGVMCHNM